MWAVLAAVVASSLAAQNPILGDSPREGPEIYGQGVPDIIRRWSRALQGSIADLAGRVRGGDVGAGVSAFLLSILFGIVHIAGPGHGKVFAVSWFSGRDARQREGLAYSAIVNVIDSVAAFALVMIGYVVLRAVVPDFRTEGPRILQLVAYALIVVFGVAHLVSHLRPHGAHTHGEPASGGQTHGEQASGGHTHGEQACTDGAHEHDSNTHALSAAPVDASSRRPPWMLAVSVGLVPCPVSTILLVYGVANGVLPFMVLMVVGVSIGGFVTMSVISLGVIAGRSRLLAILRDGAARWVTTVLEYVASGLIIAVGVVLFLGLL